MQGWGGFGCDSVVEGGGRPCLGPEPRQLAQCANPVVGGGRAGQSVLCRCPPFFGARRGIHHPTLGISPPFAAPHPPQLPGAGPGGTEGGHGYGNPSRENPCAPSLNQLVRGTGRKPKFLRARAAP